jgi:chromosomal replication initiation ATPase DnaA
VPSQLVLPLPERSAMTRDDFIVSSANSEAVAFIDSWPDWPVGLAALYGPPGSGKSHLAEIWSTSANAKRIAIADLLAMGSAGHPIVIEDIDSLPPSQERDLALFAMFERAALDAPLLLTGHEPPSQWATALPDLRSRFDALIAFPLWSSDDALLEGLARKLFADRQVIVPEAVISRMLVSLERSPTAFRDFVARADAKALSEARPVNLALIREMLGSQPS